MKHLFYLWNWMLAKAIFNRIFYNERASAFYNVTWHFISVIIKGNCRIFRNELIVSILITIQWTKYISDYYILQNRNIFLFILRNILPCIYYILLATYSKHLNTFSNYDYIKLSVVYGKIYFIISSWKLRHPNTYFVYVCVCVPWINNRSIWRYLASEFKPFTSTLWKKKNVKYIIKYQ